MKSHQTIQEYKSPSPQIAGMGELKQKIYKEKGYFIIQLFRTRPEPLMLLDTAGFPR